MENTSVRYMERKSNCSVKQMKRLFVQRVRNKSTDGTKRKSYSRPCGNVRKVQNGTPKSPGTFRTHYTFPDQELSSETLTDVSKHLGNLKYQVWETMKNICSYYPVILNPNVAPPDISVSDDLTSVTSCLRQQDEPNPLHLHRSRVVLGSVGFTDDFHA
ncbi:E3 ubiquitin-protein ligase TRIM35-like [Onychostoma macrolepis]|uniref:E3 ubiquitin-protein ligase TRIM35-like n=1 Tax=Onychostoma macrolepis TaxID=369639 RepID=UPI00272BF934|nr:E3 ubiquitin-protein ligase TRIM35-like [Onychostoma macrolepis]